MGTAESLVGPMVTHRAAACAVMRKAPAWALRVNVPAGTHRRSPKAPRLWLTVGSKAQGARHLRAPAPRPQRDRAIRCAVCRCRVHPFAIQCVSFVGVGVPGMFLRAPLQDFYEFMYLGFSMMRDGSYLDLVQVIKSGMGAWGHG
jgi:hypothetical protein